jgi:hypothetical protein
LKICFIENIIVHTIWGYHGVHYGPQYIFQEPRLRQISNTHHHPQQYRQLWQTWEMITVEVKLYMEI